MDQGFIDIDCDIASTLAITTQLNQYRVILEGLPTLSKGINSLDNVYIK